MASLQVTKILLKSRTKMSLNDRFTAYLNQKQTAIDQDRQNITQERQIMIPRSPHISSIRNTRLAQQLALRPSVLAALRLKKRSLYQQMTYKQMRSYNPTMGVHTGVRERLGVRRPNFNQQRYRPGTSPMLRNRLDFQRQRPFRRFNYFNRPFNHYNRPFNNFNRFYRPGRGGRWQPNRRRFPRRFNRRPQPPSREQLDNELDKYMAENKPVVMDATE